MYIDGLNKIYSILLYSFHTVPTIKNMIYYDRGDIVGRTSSAVKDRYNAKVYDEIKIRVSKGQKAEIKAHADVNGESVNAFIKRAIESQMQRDKESAEE